MSRSLNNVHHQCGEEGTHWFPNGGIIVTLKSPHTLTPPSFFTAVTIGAAHFLVATFLITPSASSPLKASFTAGLWANAIGQALQSQGWASCFSCIRAWIFFILPKPSQKTLACLLNTSSRTGMVSDVSDWSKANPAEQIPTILSQREWVPHFSLHKLEVP